jgi:ParB family chromosome partitioning protein
MGHARALLPLEDARRQETLAQRIEKEGLSVRQVESMVRGMLKPSAGTRRVTDQSDANLRYFQDELQRALGTRVEVIPKGKGGEIKIHYYTLEDLRRLKEHLMK